MHYKAQKAQSVLKGKGGQLTRQHSDRATAAETNEWGWTCIVRDGIFKGNLVLFVWQKVKIQLRDTKRVIACFPLLKNSVFQLLINTYTWQMYSIPTINAWYLCITLWPTLKTSSFPNNNRGMFCCSGKTRIVVYLLFHEICSLIYLRLALIDHCRQLKFGSPQNHILFTFCCCMNVFKGLVPAEHTYRFRRL